mgnify:CR=1 FL=1
MATPGTRSTRVPTFVRRRGVATLTTTNTDTMPDTKTSDLRTMHAHMRACLAREHAKREAYPGLAWIDAEQAAMLHAVNLERARRRLPHATLAELQRREQLAVGHVDYATKFALYCAELALGLPDRGP